MFLGHVAVGLAGKRIAPSVSLATWLSSAQLLDLLWPLFLLAGLEHVRIAPGITAFTPLDFYDYPITHSLVGALAWAVLFAAGWFAARRNVRVALLLAAGVLSHWLLDFLTHRPDMPILPHGPYVGLGLWSSIPATLAVELTMFAAGLWLYLAGGGNGRRRVSFWLLIGFVVVAYFAAAFGPPPPDVRTLAVSALAIWLLVPWLWWADRAQGSGLRAQGLGLRAQGLGLRAQGLGLRAQEDEGRTAGSGERIASAKNPPHRHGRVLCVGRAARQPVAARASCCRRWQSGASRGRRGCQL